MYACYQNKTVSGRESFPLWWVISENILYLSTWIVAGILLWPAWQIAGLPVLTVLWGISVLVIQIALKKHNCSGCYYYDRRCHLGWGKISAALFARDSGSVETGKKLSLFYIVSPPLVLVISVLTGVLQPVPRIYWGIAGLFIVLNAVTFPVRKAGCSRCKMRAVCPGSAAPAL